MSKVVRLDLRGSQRIVLKPYTVSVLINFPTMARNEEHAEYLAEQMLGSTMALQDVEYGICRTVEGDVTVVEMLADVDGMTEN